MEEGEHRRLRPGGTSPARRPADALRTRRIGFLPLAALLLLAACGEPPQITVVEDQALVTAAADTARIDRINPFDSWSNSGKAMVVGSRDEGGCLRGPVLLNGMPEDVVDAIDMVVGRGGVQILLGRSMAKYWTSTAIDFDLSRMTAEVGCAGR